MNIGEVVTGPFKDPQWFPKIAKASALTVLPCILVLPALATIPNLIGWSKKVAENRLRGDESLPEFDFSNIGEGWRIIVGQFLVAIMVLALMIPLLIVFGGLGFVASKIAAPLSILVSVIGLIAYVAVYLGVALASPILATRIMLDNDTTAGVRIIDALKVMRANLGLCFFYLVAILCAGILGQIAVYTVIGLFIFTPGYLAATNGIALAQFRQSGVA